MDVQFALSSPSEDLSVQEVKGHLMPRCRDSKDIVKVGEGCLPGPV